MREILFRGKRKDTGEWIEGYYAKATDYLSEKEISVIFSLDLTLFPHSEFSSYEEIIPKTVGQYTGLKDKNGKKIFEGDILLAMARKVETAPDVFVIVTDIRNMGGDYFKNGAKFFTVIGNIHDNPELLKGEEK